ncbi:hypothetical protein B0E46_15605 [Rhodanobacter sp. B04]|uniref:hypothetical protein n=1 Tax=Rhodanobacter sp. B04 TaxID=1945860 RepID=UPI0009857819|nr:hypothetical protein [Rhodanobacter sp. B04]OOG61684.1 hypothetical protein B0E46_15605 [Rhodanobacter sp. B04]
MSWAVGYDERWKRDIGYGVPSICDHSGCTAEIDRGLSYVCGDEPYGGDRGCGLYFFSEHMRHPESDRLPFNLCSQCYPRIKKPFTPTPDTAEWIHHKQTDPSWKEWRSEQTKLRGK